MSLPKYALHKAVIRNNTAEVLEILEGPEKVDIDERDAGGVPPIHYAIHLGSIPMLELLLKHGADPTRKSAAGWNTVQEAIAASNRHMVKIILASIQEKITIEYEKRLPILVEAVTKIPDFYMELKWEFHSWVPLVSRLCPHDTYKIWKRGSCFRVDTTLVGFENMKWIRGDVSFVFRGDEGGEVYVVDHKKRTVENALLTNKSKKKRNDSDEIDVRRMMSNEINRTSPLTDNVTFTASKTWLGYEKTENIGDDGWKAKIFEFEGFDLKMLNRKKIKRKDIQVLSAAERSQALLDQVDVENKHPKGLLHPNEEYTEKMKSYKGTAWISDEFPRTVEELLPIFETLAPTQKHFDKMNKFISMKMPTCGFPVKLDIPCFPTVTAKVTFLTHQEMEVEEDLFVIPEDYSLVVTRAKKQNSSNNNSSNNDNNDSSSNKTIKVGDDDDGDDSAQEKDDDDDDKEEVDVEEYIKNAEREELERSGGNNVDGHSE